MAPVFSVSAGQLEAWLVAFLWPFVRLLSLISSAPIVGEAAVPRSVKVGLGLLLSIVIAPTLDPMPAVPLFSPAGFWILLQQVLIGAAIGFSMRIVFAMVQAAGEYAGLQMGLSFASFYDATSGGNTMVVARLLNALAMLIFLASNSHLSLIALLAESFNVLPITDAPLASAGWYWLVVSASKIFAGGLMLALPLVATLLVINLAMGILNRVSPQFSIFSVGFPITLLVGMLMLQLLMPLLSPFLLPQFGLGFESISNILKRLKGF